MKLIKPSFEIIDQESGLDGIYKQIELAGRTCYKSHDKITEGSAKKFVEMMKKSGHGSTLEHGAVYLALPMETILPMEANCWGKYVYNNYSKGGKVCEVNGEKRVAISTNMRVLVENDWLDDLQYLCEPTEYHEKRVTVRFISEIGITREFNRHRVNSPSEESTRYCNYSKDKFGNEISIGHPQEFTDEDIKYGLSTWDNGQNQDKAFRKMCCSIYLHDDDIFEDVDTWLFANLACEWSYMRLLEIGKKPQFARKVLPLDLKSELVHSAFISDWKHFFELRDAKDAHPDAQFLAHGLKEEFIKRDYLQ